MLLACGVGHIYHSQLERFTGLLAARQDDNGPDNKADDQQHSDTGEQGVRALYSKYLVGPVLVARSLATIAYGKCIYLSKLAF